MRQPQQILPSLRPPKIRHPQDLLIAQKPPLPYKLARELPTSRFPRLLAPDLPIITLQISTQFLFVDNLQRLKDAVSQRWEGEHIYICVVWDDILEGGGGQRGRS